MSTSQQYYVVFYAATVADNVKEAVEIALEQVKTHSAYVEVDVEDDFTSAYEGQLSEFLEKPKGP